MRTDPQKELPWTRVSAWIAEKTGLHFPPQRQGELVRALAHAAEEFGFPDAEACAQWLLAGPVSRAQLHALAGHLTIGETYFFRDHAVFDALAKHILPELIFRSRRAGQRRLRLWSAACCTGEEPYSLAALLHQLLPDAADWRISILATDINEHFLRKAALGSYGEWSFRESPPDFKERWFTRTAQGRYEVRPELKRWVNFAHLNLAEDRFPSLVTDTHAMDVIFCRNVLMYFTADHARKVIANLNRALVEGGWLAVSASETSQVLFGQFATVNYPGTLFYRRRAKGEVVATTVAPLNAHSTIPGDVLTSALPAPWMPPTSRPSGQGSGNRSMERSAPAATSSASAIPSVAPPRADTSNPAVPNASSAESAAEQAHALANEGKLDAALEWCDRWLAADKLNAHGHYLRAVILQELARHEAARRSLNQVLYLRPDFVLAHFALGTLARADGAADEANKHFRNALHLLREKPKDELLPESDGMTAGRLKEMVAVFLTLPASHESAL